MTELTREQQKLIEKKAREILEKESKQQRVNAIIARVREQLKKSR